MTKPSADEDLRALLAEVKDRDAFLLDLYESNRAAARRLAVLEIRCKPPNRCLLLHVWKVGGAVAYYRPPYKLSPKLNQATSSESGRRANTRDGNNHWNAHASLLDDGWEMALQCDHYLHGAYPTADLLALADSAAAGKPVRLILPNSD